MKALKAFIKAFEGPQRSVKKKKKNRKNKKNKKLIFSLSEIGAGRVKNTSDVIKGHAN